MSATTKPAIFFHPNAEAVIFAQAPEVPRVDTSWLAAAALGQDKRPSRHSATTADNRVLFVQLRYAEHRRDLEDNDHARWADAAATLRSRIAEANMGLVFSAARDYGHGEERAERIAMGSLALLRAVDRFDPFRGFAFSTFATQCIKNAFSADRRNYVRRRSRVGVSAPGDHLLDVFAVWQSSRWHADEIDNHTHDARLASIRAALASDAVTNEDRAVLTARFGLDGRAPMNLSTLSKQFRVSKQTASNLVRAALVRLRSGMEARL